MKKNQVKVYLLELLLIAILFFALFASSIFNRTILSIVMIFFTFFVYRMLKKKGIHSIFKKQVFILMIVFAFLYLGAFYLFGLLSGFEKAKFILSFNTIRTFIIPLSIIIVTSELIRVKLLAQDIKFDFYGKKLNISAFFTYVAMVLVDLVIYTGVYDLSNLDDFLTALGFVLFASLSCNLLYNYITVRFGSNGIIAYRLITVLFMFIIPFTPDIYVFFRSFLRMIYPYIIYLVLEWSYSKSNFAVAYKDKRRSIIETSVVIVVISLIIMLVSCKFTYGIIVVGSRSMTGSIDIGDAVLYKAYKGEDISVNDVVIFEKNGVRIVHRVVDIQDFNGVVRYFTKGDANPKVDDDYITKKDIVGKVQFKIKYLGYPTLWVRALFE